MPQPRPRFHAGPTNDLAERRSQIRASPSHRSIGPLVHVLREDVDASFRGMLECGFLVGAQPRE